MTFVHHDHSLIFFCQITDFVQRGNQAVHRKNTIRDNNFETGTFFGGGLKLLLQILHISIFIPIACRFAKPHPVDDGSMVQRIRNYRILIGKQRFKNAGICIKTSGVQNRVFRLIEIRYFLFQFFVNILCSTNKPYTRHPISVGIHCVFCRLDNFRMAGKT